MTDLRLDTNLVDYAILATYFVVVLGVGFAARRYIRSSLDYFLSGPGTAVAAVTWIGYKVGWFSFGSDLDESMWGAGLAFVAVAIVAVAVTLMTTPKPVSDLQGLVYGMANEDEYAARRVNRWWESPKLLGYTALAGAAIVTLVFW